MVAPDGEPSSLVSRLEATFYDAEFASVSDNQFDITEYGATGDAATDCTAAIQEAIDDAVSEGGGIVTVPAGTYCTGALFVRSGVELHLAEGAVLRAIRDNDAYPNRPTRVAGIEMEWPSAVINVYDAENVRITGDGTIDGNGQYWWDTFNRLRPDYEDQGIRWAVDYDCERVRPLVVYDSADVLIEDITVERQGFWAVTMTYSERIHVTGVTIRGNVGGQGPSTDGINTDSSRDVLVERCDVDGNDDCLCIKAGRDADGLRVDRPTENVVYRHCVTYDGGGLVTIGSETSGGVRNVEVYDIRGVGTDTGVRFKSAKVRGGAVEDIYIHDLEMDGVQTVFQWDLNWNPDYSYPEIPDDIDDEEIPEHWETLTTRVTPPERGIPRFHDISIRDVTATNTTERAWYVNAYPEHPFHDIHFANTDIEAPTVGELNHANSWAMENVVVRTTEDGELNCTDCQDVDRPTIESATDQ